MEQQNGLSEDLLEEDNGGWIVTFADLMTLLLVFFVLLYSISSLNVAKFKQAMKSIQVSLGENESAIDLFDLTKEGGVQKKVVSLEDLSGLRTRQLDILKRVNEFIKERNLGENIEVFFNRGNVVIRITGTALFDSGFASLNSQGRPIMDGITQIIQEFVEFNVNIKGHTDNIPISTNKFPSNWELSAVRSTTVLRYLLEKGVNAERLTATGYADLLPLGPNNTDEDRQKNRRVEFVLEKEDE